MIHPRRTHKSLYAGLTIGLLGGSFNPAHQGHVEMSLHAKKALRLDQVWWLVSPQNPLKKTEGMAPFAARLQGAQALASQHRGLVATSLEAELGTRYTIDTLEALVKIFPKTRFVWLMGSDNLRQVPRWKRWDDLFGIVPIAVFRRFGYGAGRGFGKAGGRFASAFLTGNVARGLARQKAPAWVILNNRRNKLSSTALRQGQGSPESSAPKTDK